MANTNIGSELPISLGSSAPDQLSVGTAPIPDERVRMGEPERDNTPVFVSENCLWEIAGDAQKRGSDVEAGGVLLGRRFTDASTRKICAVIVGHVPAVAAIGRGISVTLTADDWARAIAAAEGYRNQNFVPVGWYHTHPFNPEHPERSLFFSGDDQFLHNNFFNQPGQVGMVLDATNPGGEIAVAFFSEGGSGEAYGRLKKHAGFEIYKEKDQPKIHTDLSDQIRLV